MLDNLKKILVHVFLCVSFITIAQEKKPKVALVLSGGGAKGIAHIPVLQALDSLGIVPDLIIGTSMGSAVGGLYAIGYPADSIATIAINANWDEILGGDISLDDVSVEEKSEFQRYSINLDIINGKPRLKSALLKDQNLREFIGSLVSSSYKTKHFDDFYIPFRAIATDLVNGKEVILEDGSLSTAIRASMSIPSVFQPVQYKGTLLVDGGVVNNFPTDIAKQLGADIIIGSDVGGGLQPIEELDNVATILFQTSMLTSNLKVDANRELCDILINHNANLTYSTQDFLKGRDIFDQGSIATNGSISNLSKLAELLKKYPNQKERPVLKEAKFKFDRIEYHNISSENLNLVKGRMDIEIGKEYNTTELKQAVDRAIGTELFNQINFRAEDEDDTLVLKLDASEKSQSTISGALHYDTNQGVGLVVNYTGRNILGSSSRLLLGVDIAEQPKYRIQYQQHLGDNGNWWWSTQVYNQRSLQSYYLNGLNGDDLNNKYFKSNIQINKDINSLENYIGIDLAYAYNRLKPRLSPEIPNLYDIERYSFNNLELSAYFFSNSLNKVFFPTHGTYIQARVSRSVIHDVNVDFQEQTELNTSGSTNGFAKINLDIEKRIPLDSWVTLIARLTFGLTLIDKQRSNDISFIDRGQGAFYHLGGNLNPNRRYAYTFNGMGDADLLATQFVKAHLAFQINPIRNFYCTPYLNAAVVGFGDEKDFFDNVLSPGSDWEFTNETSSVFSVGTTFSYDSILGPVNLDVAYLSGVGDLKLFFSVGLNLSIQQ